MTGLKLYQPKSNTTFGEFPAPGTLKPMTSTAPWINGTAPSTTRWLLSTPQTGLNAVEFKVNNIKNTGGIGKY